MGTDNNNRYKAVYTQIGKYLTELNPCGFNESCKSGVVSYEDAVNLYFLTSIKDGVCAGKTESVDYSKAQTQVMASGNWSIEFNTGSTQIKESKDLESIFNLLEQAETSKIRIIGHTDAVGNNTSNVTLSKGRAQSVVDYLINKGIKKERFQLVDGKGSSEPVADNKTETGRSKNRRVVITLLK